MPYSLSLSFPSASVAQSCSDSIKTQIFHLNFPASAFLLNALSPATHPHPLLLSLYTFSVSNVAYSQDFNYQVHYYWLL